MDVLDFAGRGWGMSVMAKARKRKADTGESPAPRKVIAQLKASEDFHESFNRMLVHLQLSPPSCSSMP
jgi:hypothetical protein